MYIKSFISRYLSRNYAPRWVILFLDIMFVFLSFFITIIVKQNISGEVVPIGQIFLNFLIFSFVYCLSIVLFRIYAGIIRYMGTVDMIRILLTIIVSSISLYLVDLFCKYVLQYEGLIFSWLFIASSGVVVFIFLGSFKFSVKLAYLYWFKERKEFKKVIVLGTGNDSVRLVIGLQSELKSVFRPIAFLRFKRYSGAKNLSHIPVLSYEKGTLKSLFERWDCKTLLITTQQISYVKKNMADECLENGIQIMIANYSSTLEDQQNTTAPTISTFQIEDLLGRETIKLNNNIVSSRVNDSTVLITGAAGSIGSEIARQVISYQCKRLLMFDIAESPLYDLKYDLERINSQAEVVLVVGDIRDRTVVQQLFEREKIDFVYHAAAYKHVPIMEAYPAEAILTNVMGTKNVVECALEKSVSHFVMVSTDKAVNPTNVMGASKRIAEMIVQTLFYEFKERAKREGSLYSRVVTTRFGNVLGSNGSVVPLFKKQIEQGGPVTITDRNIIRYFMTISEACSLVLEAGCMGKGGEIFVFDMGSPMKIYDLAKKMICLAGKRPELDVPIIETGLRPGEKLYEELLVKTEEAISTYNSKIMIARVPRVAYSDIEGKVEELILAAKERSDSMLIVRKMKEIVPEFVSNNSSYSAIDEDMGRQK